MSIGTPEFSEHLGHFTDANSAVIEDRRRLPRQDFLSQLARGFVEGVSLTDEDIAGLMIVYFVGGHHSTSSGIAGLFRHLLTEPGLRDALMADPGLIPHAIEESLRLTTPLQLFARTVMQETQVGDQTLSAGTRVMLNLAAANHDPRAFDEPDRFVLDRSSNRHVAFGAGIHVCPGQNLARAELRIVLERLLTRLPDVRLAAEPVRTRLIGGQLLGFDALPVTFTPESAGGDAA
jgi:cytochrome P450